MKTFPAKQSQNGLTLIELMIAMMLGVFLMVGILKIFSSSKQAYKLQENLSRLQENGRFAMDFITKDVRMAGYTGCSKALPATVPINTITEQTKTNGVDGGNNLPDTLNFQYAKSCSGQLTTKMSSPAVNSNIQIGANNCGIKANSTLLIGDCAGSDVFSAASVTNTTDSNSKTTASTVTNATALTKTYDVDAELFTFQSVTYNIQTGASGLPALFRIDSSGTNELVEGIENLQILYGVDEGTITAGAVDKTKVDYIPNYYVTAAQVPALINNANGWTRVVSVRISLVAVSPDNGLIDAPQPYAFNGTTITPPDICFNNGITTPLPCTAPAKQMQDLRLRRVFSTTIAIRNRLP